MTEEEYTKYINKVLSDHQLHSIHRTTMNGYTTSLMIDDILIVSKGKLL